MTSRSSFNRRPGCQSERPARSAGSPIEPTGLATVGAPVEYWLDALDEPTRIYAVVVSVIADVGDADGALARLRDEVQDLTPSHSNVRGERLALRIFCPAPSAQAAAWKLVERLRTLDGAVLLQVEAGLPDAPAPQVVLTGRAAWTRVSGDNDDGPEAALCR